MTTTRPMSDIRPLALGDPLPSLRLHTADGADVALSAFLGRTLVLVCVRYYG